MLDKNFMLQRFINKATSKFGDKFDYSKVLYINASSKITVVCPEHGEFETTPTLFLQSKHGCRKCSFKLSHDQTKKTTKLFIEEAKLLYGDRFDYSKVDYINSDAKVIIVCPEHGEFLTRPADFLRGHNCPKCKDKQTSERNKENKADTLETFVLKARKVHSDKYDYSKVQYVNSRTPVTIICAKHGEFVQLPSHHLQGVNCPLCNAAKGEEFISNLLKELNIMFIPQFKVQDSISTMYVDFCIKVGEHTAFIEYNGEQHYNCLEVFGGLNSFTYQVDRDSRLRDYCFDNDIPILEIKYNTSKEDVINKVKKLIDYVKNRP